MGGQTSIIIGRGAPAMPIDADEWENGRERHPIPSDLAQQIENVLREHADQGLNVAEIAGYTRIPLNLVDRRVYNRVQDILQTLMDRHLVQKRSIIRNEAHNNDNPFLNTYYRWKS